MKRSFSGGGIGVGLNRRGIGIVAGFWVILMGNGCTLPHWSAREEARPGVVFPIIYNQGYNVDVFGFENTTRFDGHRYEKIYMGLYRAGLVNGKTVIVPGRITDEELLNVHTADWVRKTHDPRYVAQTLEVGVIRNLPRGLVEDRIVDPFRYQTKGTVLAVRYALNYGVAATLGGGLSHAQADQGEGFNLFADVPLAVKMLRKEAWDGRIFILDVDAHHGQGNAAFFAGDESVFLMDVYNRDNYPGQFEPVDLAIELERGATDEQYLDALEKKLPKALKRFKPDLMIYVAGVDCCVRDRIGGLAVSEAGINARDRFVIDQCAERQIPLCMTLSGGYWKGSHRPSVEMIKYAAKRLGRASMNAE
jgi:histone deacetylase 11